MITLQPWQWALMALAAFVVGVAKAGISGLGIFSVALAASVLPPRASVGVMLIVLLSGDALALRMYRREADRRYLQRLFPWAALGVIGGTLALGRFDDAGVGHLIGAVLVLIVVVYFIRQRTATADGAELLPFVHHPWLVGATGVLAGFTTMIANAAGPIMVLYLLAMRLPKAVFVGTSAWFFLTLNLFKIPFSIWQGLLTPASAVVALCLTPFTVAGALVGRRLLHAVDQRLFERLVLLLTLVAALRLLL